MHSQVVPFQPRAKSTVNGAPDNFIGDSFSMSFTNISLIRFKKYFHLTAVISAD